MISLLFSASPTERAPLRRSEPPAESASVNQEAGAVKYSRSSNNRLLLWFLPAPEQISMCVWGKKKQKNLPSKQQRADEPVLLFPVEQCCTHQITPHDGGGGYTLHSVKKKRNLHGRLLITHLWCLEWCLCELEELSFTCLH